MYYRYLETSGKLTYFVPLFITFGQNPCPANGKSVGVQTHVFYQLKKK